MTHRNEELYAIDCFVPWSKSVVEKAELLLLMSIPRFLAHSVVSAIKRVSMAMPFQSLLFRECQ